MGHKVHPTGFRLGVTENWRSMWYADSKQFADYLNTDIKVREYIRQKLAHASVSRIDIQRPARNALVTIHTAECRYG